MQKSIEEQEKELIELRDRLETKSEELKESIERFKKLVEEL